MPDSLQLEKDAIVKDVEQAKKEIKDGQAKLAGQDVALGDYAKVNFCTELSDVYALLTPSSLAVWQHHL